MIDLKGKMLILGGSYQHYKVVETAIIIFVPMIYPFVG